MRHHISGEKYAENKKTPFPDLPVVFYHSVVVHDIKVSAIKYLPVGHF